MPSGKACYTFRMKSNEIIYTPLQIDAHLDLVLPVGMIIVKKLKNIAYALMLSLALPLSANADLIDIIDLETRDAGTTHNGFTVTGSFSPSGNTYTFSFTQTGNLDSGTVDDTLSFDLIYEAYTGSTISGGNVTLGTTQVAPIVTRNWHTGSFDAGETLSLQIANVSYTDGEGDGTIVFNGFQAITPTSYTDTPTGNIDYYVGLAGATTITDDPTFNADLLTANGTSTSLFFTAGGGPVRLRNLDFQFETITVPEPSSIMLFGLALSGLAFRRRV